MVSTNFATTKLQYKIHWTLLNNRGHLIGGFTTQSKVEWKQIHIIAKIHNFTKALGCLEG